MSEPGIGALYLHVPFCVNKCAYCDFESAATAKGDPRISAHVDTLVRKVEHLGQLGLLEECRTVYVGGGTPTMVSPQKLGQLVGAVRDLCPNLRELTCEANPESLSDAHLAALGKAGATRLSIGVQSLDDGELQALGRVHSAELARKRVHAAVRAGFDVSCDLMCAIPRQTKESWQRTLEGVLALGVHHVSVYPLTLEEGTPLGRRYQHEDAPFNSEDVQADRMEQAARMLQVAGLRRYEVASYAFGGKQCAHNIAYWTGVEYLGLGRGAASMLSVATYHALQQSLLAQAPAVPKDCARVRLSRGDLLYLEFLDERQALAEDLMLGMRMAQGVDANAVSADLAQQLVERGLVARHEGRLCPTHDGWLLGNELYGALWDLAASPVTEASCNYVAWP